MHGRLVAITGASSGIGLATARAFAARGDRVVALARDGERLATLAAEVDGVVPRVADVTDADGFAAACAAIVAEQGVPDVVVANAGVGLDARFVDMDDAALRRVFEVNVFGAARTIRAFLPGMIRRGSGRVLLISSIVGKRGTPHYSAYSASKFALHGLADALRVELLGSGISVGLVCPSSTETEFRTRMARAGAGQNSFRPRRHSAESVARAIVRMADSRRREVILGIEAKLLHWADALFPGLVDRLLARALDR